jgi:TetR/AcrR family transcriptional regulator, repressor of fatR-cypB operon
MDLNMPYLNKKVADPEPIDCRILTAGLKLFVKHGYHKVSVHDIQKLANVSIGSIYNHFGGKEGIANKLYYHILNEMDELVDDGVRNKTTTKEKCEEIIRLLFNYTESHRDIISFVFQPNHRDFLPEEPPICSASPFQRMRDIIEQGMQQGEIRQMPTEIAASAIFGVAIRMVQLRLDGIVVKPLPEYLDEVLDAGWHGIIIHSPC